MEFTYLKYLLTLLFISSFYNFIFGKKSNILTCGLVAYCGNKPVNFEWIKILMLYNMSRGTHASGFCINNEVIKNTVPASKLIATYAEDFKYTQNTQFTVIAHDRQASQGSKENKNLAHPFLFEREGKAKGFIIGMHNGTITNSADICEKYKITHDYTHSDSYFLYKIMAKQPVEATFDPIKDIAGTATLIFFNPIVPNQLFVLRDKDRELFYWKPDEDSIYISSIEESLYAIGAPEKSVVEFDENKMFTINKGQISKEEPLIKKPYYKPYIHNHKKDTYGYSSVQSGGVHKTENDFFRNNKKRTTKSFTGVIYEGIPKAPAQLNNKEHFLKWYNGHYYLGDTLAHGSFLVNDHTGYTLEIFNNSNTYEGYTKYYFIFGNMMFSQVSFSDIKTKINPKKDLTLQEEYKEFLKIPGLTLAEKTVFPVRSNPVDTFYFALDNHKNKFNPKFSNVEITLDQHGYVSSVVNLETGLIVSEDEVSKDNVENFDVNKTAFENCININKEKTSLSYIYASWLSMKNLDNSIETKTDFVNEAFDFFESQELIVDADIKKVKNEFSSSDIFESDIKFLLNSYYELKNLEKEFNSLDEEDEDEEPVIDAEFSLVDNDLEKFCSKVQTELNFYNNYEFTSAIMDHEYSLLSDLLLTFINDGSDKEELNDFYTSVLSTLKSLKFISAEQFVHSFNKQPEAFISDVRYYYKNYIESEKPENKKETKNKKADEAVAKLISDYYNDLEKMSSNTSKLVNTEKAKYKSKLYVLQQHLVNTNTEIEKLLASKYNLNIFHIKKKYESIEIDKETVN